MTEATVHAGYIELPDGKLDLRAAVLATDHDRVVAGLREQINQHAQAANAWRELFWSVARELKCLPSSFPDDNDHVIKAASQAKADKDKLQAQMEYVRNELAGCEVARWRGGEVARKENYEAAYLLREERDTLRAEVERLRAALEKIAAWPDGGNQYGQERIKKFARAALEASHDRRTEDGNG